MVVVSTVAAGVGDLDAARYCYDALLPNAHYYSYSASGCWGAMARLLGALAPPSAAPDEADRHFAERAALPGHHPDRPVRVRRHHRAGPHRPVVTPSWTY